MKLHLIINHSRPPYISQSIAFLDEKNCQEYMTLNQKNLAHKSLQLSKYLIDVRGELAPNQRMIYALFDLNDSAHYTDNIIPGIKRARHIEGFYADETALYMAQNSLPLVHNRKFSEIHYIPIEDLKPMHNKKNKP